MADTTHKVLLIDDDPINNLVNKKQLERQGSEINITVFQEAKAALDFLDKINSNDSLLILLDINMPQVDGWDFLEGVKGRLPNIKIVMLTSSIDAKDRQRAFAYQHVVDYIIKPLTREKAAELLTQF